MEDKGHKKMQEIWLKNDIDKLPQPIRKLFLSMNNKMDSLEKTIDTMQGDLDEINNNGHKKGCDSIKCPFGLEK